MLRLMQEQPLLPSALIECVGRLIFDKQAMPRKDDSMHIEQLSAHEVGK
ncbi:MAG: hypothetical protein WAW73_18450 [Rhodoferax sp.]